MTEAVKEWMSGDPVSIEADACAADAIDRMLRHGVRHLPVLDGDRRVVGVVSLDDLRAALPFPFDLRHPLSAGERKTAREWRIADVMSAPPVTVPAEASLQEAADRMADDRLGCLPVVDADGRLVAMLSETDLLRALATSQWSHGVQTRRREEGP